MQFFYADGEGLAIEDLKNHVDYKVRASRVYVPFSYLMPDRGRERLLVGVVQLVPDEPPLYCCSYRLLTRS